MDKMIIVSPITGKDKYVAIGDSIEESCIHIFKDSENLDTQYCVLCDKIISKEENK